jgi:sulfite reductase alpha subunit-like flavoprotein
LKWIDGKKFNWISFTDGKASERYGVCSNYLESLDKDDEVQIFIRSAPAFHMPKDVSQPIILIGPGLFSLTERKNF